MRHSNMLLWCIFLLPNEHGALVASNGMPLTDICDELSGKDENDTRGRYPKDFKFTGWHPLCRCHVVPILVSRAKIKEITRARIKGEDYTIEGQVTQMPTEFNKWVADNAQRIERAKQRRTLPYFLKDNRKQMRTSLKIAQVAERKANVVVPNNKINGRVVADASSSKRNSRTIEEVKDIKRRWELRNKFPFKDWEHTYIQTDGVGYVVTQLQRIKDSNKSPNEIKKYERERRTSIFFASKGHRIEQYSEISGVSSADILFDGKKADLKSTKNGNNMQRDASKAKNKQGAKISIFEVSNMTSKIRLKFEELSRKGYHGLYYIIDDPSEYSF